MGVPEIPCAAISSFDLNLCAATRLLCECSCADYSGEATQLPIAVDVGYDPALRNPRDMRATAGGWEHSSLK